MFSLMYNPTNGRSLQMNVVYKWTPFTNGRHLQMDPIYKN